jgi:hypothetical protein
MLKNADAVCVADVPGEACRLAPDLTVEANGFAGYELMIQDRIKETAEDNKILLFNEIAGSNGPTMVPPIPPGKYLLFLSLDKFATRVLAPGKTYYGLFDDWMGIIALSPDATDCRSAIVLAEDYGIDVGAESEDLAVVMRLFVAMLAKDSGAVANIRLSEKQIDIYKKIMRIDMQPFLFRQKEVLGSIRQNE